MQHSVSKLATVWLQTHTETKTDRGSPSPTQADLPLCAVPGEGQRVCCAPDVAALHTGPDAGSTVLVEVTVPRMPPWGFPGLASP